MKRLAEPGKNFQFDNTFIENPLELDNYKIVQIGELCCEGGYDILPHMQKCHEISFILSGTGMFTCGTCEYHVEQGDVIISPIALMHTIHADIGCPLRFFYLGFDIINPQHSEPYISVDKLFRTALYHKLCRYNELSGLVLSVLDEFYNKKLGFQQAANSYVELLILLTCRGFINEKAVKYIPNLDKNSIGNAAYAVVRYVDKNILNITDIRTVAAELGYSYTYLSHMFKQKTDVTLQHYINLRRMEWAKQMLTAGSMSVTQVSDTLKYETIQSFSRAFRRTIGESPAAYIKSSIINRTVLP